MKKILGIVVLGLLLTNNTNAGTLEEDLARDTYGRWSLWLKNLFDSVNYEYN